MRGVGSQLNKPKKLKAPGFYHLIRQASPATFPVKGKDSTLSKSPYFYTLASIVILTILSILILNLKLSLTNAAGSEGSNDSGIATLSRVDITQAGTGQSVTIDGTTLDEEGENNEVDNAKRRTILNNNVVRYQADLQVSTPGSLTLSITLPANNTIDEATIGSAQGCITGSKLEAVTVDGKKSYTNNKATCVMNTTSIGQVSWGITAYLWGGNNTQIQPTISLSGIAQSQKPDPITVVGKGNYDVQLFAIDYNDASNGVNRSVAIAGRVKTPKSSTNVLGVSPLDLGKYTISIDMNGMPKGWSVSKSDNYDFSSNCNGEACTAMSGYRDIVPNSAENTLLIKIEQIATAVRKWPSVNVDGVKEDEYVWSSFRLYFDIPVSSLTNDSKSYEMRVADSYGSLSNERIDIPTSRQTMSWSLSSSGSASIAPYVTKPSYSGSGATGGHILPGWSSAWISGSAPVYTGQKVLVGFNFNSNSIPTSNKASNVYMCQTWDSSRVQVSKFVQSTEFTYGVVGDIEYGVIDGSSDSVPDVLMCGRVGDTKSNKSFFSNLDDAKAYASSVGASVNAMRMRIPELAAGRDVKYGYSEFTPLSAYAVGHTFSFGATSDNWSVGQLNRSYALVPGLLSHTITAVPSSNAPNTTDHVTITPKTYNRDTNVKIATALPKGLTYQSGSFRVGDHQLSQGLDYDIAKQSNGTTVITFNMDQIARIPGLEDIVGEPAIMPGEPGNDTDLPIAKDNNGNGIVRDAIEFDVLVDSNVPTPSTLTITSQVSGTGTNYAASTFRAASTSVTISQARVFGYNLTSSASSLNVNEDLTYTYSNYNLTDDDIANLDTISVLPFNNDSRGSYGLSSYNLSSLTVTSSDKDLSLPTIYYTTDPIVRELERTNPAELATGSSITWIKCNLDAQGRCTNLPNASTSGDADASANGGVAAVRWQLPSFAKGAQYYINLTINDLDAESAAKLANDITYVSADGIVAATHQSPTTTSYVGESLGLRMDTANLVTTLNPNDATTLTNHLTILSNTRHGYNLTINMVGDSNDLVGQSSERTIPAINTKPQSGAPGWSISTNSSDWQAVPTAIDQGLLLYSNAQSGQTTTNLPVTYGFSTTESTVADTYRGQVVYTLVGI